jgi:hypothetical protein
VDLNHRPRPYQGLLWCYMHSSVAMITLLTTSLMVTSWHDCWFQVARAVQSGDHFLQTLELYRTRVFSKVRSWAGCSARVRYSRLNEAARAADAGPMEIECRKGLASGCAETVRRSTADDTARPESAFLEKILQSEPLRKPKEQICPAVGRTTTDRGEARRILLMKRVVSCGSSDQRWRTKLHFGRRESFDDHHRSSTVGAEPKISEVLGA